MSISGPGGAWAVSCWWNAAKNTFIPAVHKSLMDRFHLLHAALWCRQDAGIARSLIAHGMGSFRIIVIKSHYMKVCVVEEFWVA